MRLGPLSWILHIIHQWFLVSGNILDSNAASADSLVSLTYIFRMTDQVKVCVKVQFLGYYMSYTNDLWSVETSWAVMQLRQIVWSVWPLFSASLTRSKFVFRFIFLDTTWQTSVIFGQLHWRNWDLSTDVEHFALGDLVISYINSSIQFEQ